MRFQNAFSFTHRLPLPIALALLLTVPAIVSAATRIRIMPPDRATFAIGQRFDLRVEATADGGPSAAPPSGLIVTINGEDITSRNVPGASGGAPAYTTNFLLRDYSFAKPGSYVIEVVHCD